MFTKIISISLGAILINNFIFSQFLGCCPFLGCSNKVDTAVGMGLAVTFVMGLASAICWVVDQYILVPLGLAYPPDAGVHPDNRGAGSVRRDVPQEVHPLSCTPRWASTCPLSPPTAPFWASFC